MLTVLAKTDHEAAEREIKEYVRLFHSLYNTSKGFRAQNKVPANTGGRPDHITGPVEDVLIVILPFHQLPSIDATSNILCYGLTLLRSNASPPTHARASAGTSSMSTSTIRLPSFPRILTPHPSPI